MFPIKPIFTTYLLLFSFSACVQKDQNNDKGSEDNKDSTSVTSPLKDSLEKLTKENALLKTENNRLANQNKNLLKQPRPNSFGGKSFLVIFLFEIFLFVLSLFTLAVLLRQLKLVRGLKKQIEAIPFAVKNPGKGEELKREFTGNSKSLLVTTSKQIVTGKRSFSNIAGKFEEDSIGNKWFLVGASAIGKSHVSNNTPCQDNHYCENLGLGWGMAIVCDGAGSAPNSHIGSEFIAKEAALKVFKDLVNSNEWQKKNYLPSEGEWRLIIKEKFLELRESLEKVAKAKQVPITSLACTLIIVIFSPVGLLSAHIGDGRAGFCNEKGEWKSILTPHKGEEANQTIFISSNSWFNSADFRMSGVWVPESRVITEKPVAFTLMSDGCEAHSFDCSKMDSKTNKWTDPNIPNPKFFNPLVAQLQSMHDNKVSIDQANEMWRKFIEEGNEGSRGFREEPDDKTLILGILITNK